MKQGYDVFGKAYGVMNRNDLHAVESVDHQLMREMILLDEDSRAFLYRAAPALPDMRGHALYAFAQQFRRAAERDTIEAALAYCADIARSYDDVPFETMRFGGTEQEILERGTDWCADMARVGVALLNCCGVPARILHAVNPQAAYNGHVLTEAFYEGKFGVCDFLHGLRFHDGAPLDAWQLLTHRAHLSGLPCDYADTLSAIAVSEYNPMNPANNYAVSAPNEYTLTLIRTDHQNRWIMGEDE